MQILCIDTLGPLNITDNRNHHIVIITDLFTKWPIAIPVKEVTAKVIAEILLNDVIALYGPMKQLQSDRGTSFMARVVRELCHMFDIQKTCSTAFRAQVNDQTE